MKKKPTHRADGRGSAKRWIIASLLLVLALVLGRSLIPSPPIVEEAESAFETLGEHETEARYAPGSQVPGSHIPGSNVPGSPAAPQAPQARSHDPGSGTVLAQPVQFAKRVLVDKPWNSEPDALGRFELEEGAILGPTAVATVGDSIYVFDNNNLGEGKLLVYDTNGQMRSSIPLPGGLTWADMVVDPSDSSLYVIDHPYGSIYKIQGGEIIETHEVSLRDFSLGEQFGYDERTRTLYVRDHELGGDIPILIDGQLVDPGDRVVQSFSPVSGSFDPDDPSNLILNFRDGENLTVAFNGPVESLDELIVDAQGRVWVIFTFEWDYRMRRVARIDPAQKTAGVELLDIQFAYETVRRMAPNGNGIVIVSGDDDNGRLVALQ